MIDLAAIEAARARIADIAVRTPLVRLRLEDAPAEIYLKLETLQPIGSFKIRGAASAVRSAPDAERARGLVTVSAGNMAQGVAWVARELGLPATIAVPEHASAAKLAAIDRLGGRVLKLPYDTWWQAMVEARVPGVEGLLVHPVQDEAVMAGNGTIGLEILEDLPDVDAVVIPYGGGGLTVGIASAIRALRPQTKIFTAEPATAAGLHAALAAGEPADAGYAPPPSSTAPAAGGCSTPCGRGCSRSSTPHSPFRPKTRRRRSACWRSGYTSSPKARGAVGRRGPERSRRRRQGRVHRVRRQHRSRAREPYPEGSDSLAGRG